MLGCKMLLGKLDNFICQMLFANKCTIENCPTICCNSFLLQRLQIINAISMDGDQRPCCEKFDGLFLREQYLKEGAKKVLSVGSAADTMFIEGDKVQIFGVPTMCCHASHQPALPFNFLQNQHWLFDPSPPSLPNLCVCVCGGEGGVNTVRYVF